MGYDLDTLTYLGIFIFGIFLGILLCYFGKKNRWHEFICFTWPPSIYCWLIELDEKNKTKLEKPHHGIVVVATKRRTKFAMYWSGVSTLLLSFTENKQKIPYRLYVCSKQEDFKRIVFDRNVTHLWLFGHGLKHAMEFGKELLYYCEFQDAPKKEFIGQYHCNPDGGKSLADYNNPKLSDVTDGVRHLPEIEQCVQERLKELGISPIVLNYKIFLGEIKRKICGIWSKK
jgi:hypothetical protein